MHKPAGQYKEKISEVGLWQMGLVGKSFKKDYGKELNVSLNALGRIYKERNAA